MPYSVVTAQQACSTEMVNYCIRYYDDLSCCESHVLRFVALFVYALLIRLAGLRARLLLKLCDWTSCGEMKPRKSSWYLVDSHE